MDSFEKRTKLAVLLAKQASDRYKDWMELNNALFGVGGSMGNLFPTRSERKKFEKTAESKQIHKIINSRRENNDSS